MSNYSLKRICTFFAVTAILLACSPAMASLVTNDPNCDSANWALNYEFDVLPSTQDLDGLGGNDFSLNGDAGTLSTDTYGNTIWTMGSTSGTSYFMASGSSQIWDTSGITTATGYTIETRLRVNSSTGDTGACYIQGTIDGSSAFSQLLVSDDKQSWGYNQTVGENNNSDDFHVFRIVQEPNASLYHVWRDNTLVGTYLPSGYSYSGDLDRLLIGDGGGTSFGGNIDFDYLRLTKGAYAPATTPAAIVPSVQKNSADFTYCYEMDVDPTDYTQINLDGISGNTSNDWTATIGSNGSVALTGNGTLAIDPNGDSSAYLDAGIASSDLVWRNEDFSLSEGFTVEISLKLDPSNTDTFGLCATTGDTMMYPRFGIAPDGQYWNDTTALGEEGATYDNTDDFHLFRMAFTPLEDGGKWFIWRDGILLTPDGIESSNTISSYRDALYFGDLGHTEQAAGEVDYIRFMAGAYAPTAVPEPSMVLLVLSAIAGLAWIRRHK